MIARRAAEEATGTVRWLRPDFQNPPKNVTNETKKQEQQTLINKAVDHSIDNKLDVNSDSTLPLLAQAPSAAGAAAVTSTASVPMAATQPWSATLPEQVRAVADALAASPVPLTVEQLAQRFKDKGPWKKSLPTLIQILQALSRAQPVAGLNGLGYEGGEVT